MTEIGCMNEGVGEWAWNGCLEKPMDGMKKLNARYDPIDSAMEKTIKKSKWMMTDKWLWIENQLAICYELPNITKNAEWKRWLESE